MPHDAWLEAMPRQTYAKRFVHQKLCEAFNERVTAHLNGWVYEARAETDDGCFCFPSFLDQEKALAAAMAEFPDIKYREEDFAAITTYTLRKKELQNRPNEGTCMPFGVVLRPDVGFSFFLRR